MRTGAIALLLAAGLAASGACAGDEPVGGEAWRARARLARGDCASALPLLTGLHGRLGAAEGPDALLAAAGLAACLADDDPGAARSAWLTAYALHEKGLRLPDDLAAMIPMDSATGLMPALPPPGGGARALGGLPGAAAPGFEEGTRARAMAALYAMAERDEPVEEGALPPASEDQAVSLVRLMVSARLLADPEERASARAALRAMLGGNAGSWREAWIRLGLGRSLLRESDEALRDEGLLELLHLPARFSGEHPALAAAALAEVGSVLEERGDAAQSGAVREQHRRVAPGRRITAEPDLSARSPGGAPTNKGGGPGDSNR